MVYVILGTGFEEVEALTPVDVLRRCGVEVRTAGIGGNLITGAHGIGVAADCTLEEVEFDQLDMIVLPGGLGGVQSVMECPAALELVQRTYEAGRWVAAICAAPTILAHLGITDGRKVTSFPGTEQDMGAADYQNHAAVVADGKIVTAQAVGSAMAFALKLAEVLCGEKTSQTVAERMVVR